MSTNTNAGASSSRPNRFIRQPRPPVRAFQPVSSHSPSPYPSTSRPQRRQPVTIPSSSSSPPIPPPQPPETISLHLTRIATSLSSSLTLISSTDQSHWSEDEHAQVQALESLLSTSARDFQDLTQLLGGGLYFSHDNHPETLSELRGLAAKFEGHEAAFRDWSSRTGGPINPLWERETRTLGRELARAMRRAAGRVWTGNRVGGSEEWVGGRCLGAEIVHRAWKGRKKDAAVGEERKGREGEIGGWRQEEEEERRNGKGIVRERRERRGSLEGVVPVCNSVGRFERLGSEDVTFVCDYCDGFMVWPNLAEVPGERRRAGSLTVEGYPNWAARGRRCTVKLEEGEEETRDVVFAPLAIANHVPPRYGEWMSRIVCPYCEEYTYIDSGDDGDGERKWTPEQEGFESVEGFREHLAWSHSAMAKPVIPGLGDKCAVM